MDAEELDRLVRLGLESFNRRDAEAAIEIWDPDCEWHPFLSAQVEAAAGYRGHEGIRQWFRDTEEMFSGIAWAVDEVRDLGNDRVVVLGRIRARGRGSGVEVSSELGQVFDLRDGKVRRGWAYPDHQQAKRAAGLDP